MENRVNRYYSSEGTDNLAATGDDGSDIRPELVIRIQPPTQQDRYRAALPVTTVDWQSNPQGQFIPVHGLDFLTGVTSLLIKQTVELNELTSKIESENRYIVKVPQGESLYIASEVSTPSQRCLCGSGRAFIMHLHDNTRQEALQFHRRLAAASCCFPCRLQEMQVITPPGDYIGRIRQQWTWMIPFYFVQDASDNILFIIEGPAVFKRSALVQTEFKILSKDYLRVLGRIVHGWDRELVSFTTTLHIPETTVQPKHKALLLGAAFLLSLETYSGSFLHNMMHGMGEYRWKFKGIEGSFTTYEGYFYSNHMHGYGVMSYDDGRVFKGLYYENVRWGPGVESHACLRADVGLWRGKHLMRLAWIPPNTAIPDLNSISEGRKHTKQHLVVLSTVLKKMGELSKYDLDLLKPEEFASVSAPQKRLNIDAKNCIHLKKRLCQREACDIAYYGDTQEYLSFTDKSTLLASEEPVNVENDDLEENKETKDNNMYFYAWNNNPLIIHMMGHSFKHDKHRFSEFNLTKALSGPRKFFKPAGDHELNCRAFLLASYVGNIELVSHYIVDGTVYCNLSDSQGNTALMYATAGNQTDLMHFLVEAGADVNWYNDACVTPLGIALLNYLAVQCDVPQILIAESVTLPPGPEIRMFQVFSYLTYYKEYLRKKHDTWRDLSLDKIMLTIKKLLDDGADPRRVCSPQPALLFAIAAESPKLAHLLIDNGAEVNVVYKQFLDCTPLDLVVCRPMSDETLDLLKILLEGGAEANRRCPNSSASTPGPTLLHVLIAKPFQNETQEIIRSQMITLLLNYGCDPTAFFKGQSALDLAMTKRPDLMGTFIKNPNTDLNALINEDNQTILFNMFSLNNPKIVESSFKKDLMNLLLFGADPLLECSKGDITYPNLFVYINENIHKMSAKNTETVDVKNDVKKAPPSLKVLPKLKSDNSLEYALAMNQVEDCVRMLHVRWIQGKLMSELIEVIVKYRHRAWHMVMKEYHNRKRARLWLNTERCLQIWDIFKKSNKKDCSDNHVLRLLLSIVYYFNIRHHLSVKLTFQEKEKIDRDVSVMMRDHKEIDLDYQNIQQGYVKPELFVNAENKFNVCFDCYLPLTETSISCASCQLVSFCNFDCMKDNCQKIQDHPCTKFLIDKYFLEAV